MSDLYMRDPRTFELIGAALEVHHELGGGFLEAVYQSALEIELGLRGVPFVAQPKVTLSYKGTRLRTHYIPDFVAFGSVIVEIKAQRCLTVVDDAQIINTLRATGMLVGTLINFGEPSLRFKRFVHGQTR